MPIQKYYNLNPEEYSHGPEQLGICVGKKLQNTFLGHFFTDGIPSIFCTLGTTLTRSCEKPSANLSPAHFLPGKFIETKVDGIPWIQDETTEDYYCNDSHSLIRAKCAALVLSTPIIQTAKMLLSIINRVAKVATFAHFRQEKNFQKGASLLVKDLSMIVLSPIILVGLQFAAIYGIISPYNGRKLYATLERMAFGDQVLAPCFQPGRITPVNKQSSNDNSSTKLNNVKEIITKLTGEEELTSSSVFFTKERAFNEIKTETLLESYSYSTFLIELKKDPESFLGHFNREINKKAEENKKYLELKQKYDTENFSSSFEPNLDYEQFEEFAYIMIEFERQTKTQAPLHSDLTVQHLLNGYEGW